MDGGKRDRILGVSHGLAYRDSFYAGQCDDISGLCLLDWDLLQPLETVELRDLCLFDRTAQLAHRDRVADCDFPGENAADRNPTDIVAVSEVGHEDLEAVLDLGLWRRNGLEDLLEQRPQILRIVV